MQIMEKANTLTLNFVYSEEVTSWEGVSANLVIRDVTSAENPVSIVVWGTNQLSTALETMSFDVVNPSGLARYSISLELARGGSSLFSCSVVQNTYSLFIGKMPTQPTIVCGNKKLSTSIRQVP